MKAPLIGCLASPERIGRPGDLFRYRTLARGDFRVRLENAAEILEEGPEAARAFHLEAGITCTAELEIRETRDGRFQAAPGTVRYLAVANPDRSWWNPVLARDAAHSLAHHQIHFALVELAAHGLDAERESVLPTLRGSGNTAQQALDALQEIWGKHFEEARARLRDLHARYDRETRWAEDLPQQRAWAERIEGELVTRNDAPAAEP